MKNKLDFDRLDRRENKAWLNEVRDDVEKKLERDQKSQRAQNVLVPKHHRVKQYR
jgi:hypothetical protein